MWHVERHGGRDSDTWRIVYCGNDEEVARQKFRTLRTDMRQGGVSLTKDGKQLDYSWAPRLRSRW